MFTTEVLSDRVEGGLNKIGLSLADGTRCPTPALLEYCTKQRAFYDEIFYLETDYWSVGMGEWLEVI